MSAALVRKSKLAQDLFVRDALATIEGSTGPIKRGGCLGRDLFVLDGSQGKRARKRVHDVSITPSFTLSSFL